MTRTHVVRSDGVVWVELDGDVLAWDGVRLHLLAAGAARVWRAVDGACTAAEVTAAVARGVAVPAETVATDVTAFLAELAEQGLVGEVEGTPGPRWAVPPGVGWVRDGDVVVLVRHGSGVRDVLSPSGSRIFELAWEGLALPELVAELAAEFPDAPADLADVVRTALGDLVDRGYLVVVGGAP